MARRRPVDHDPEEPDDWDDQDVDMESQAIDGDSDAETGFCPECGAEIYDAADVCPKCFTWIDGDTLRRDPRTQRARSRWTVLVVWALIAAIAAGAGALWLAQLLR